MNHPSWVRTVARAHAKCFICKQRIEKGTEYMLRDVGYAADRAHIGCCESWQASLRRAAKGGES